MKWLWTTMMLFGLVSAGAAASAETVQFKFTLPKDAALTSAGVYDADGRLVKTLWTQKPMKAGSHTAEWDGTDEFGEETPAGEYSYHVVLNNTTYKNVGILGNTGEPHNELQHIQHGVASMATDREGRIFTANGWEEAGHDFKVFNPDGTTAYHARYQMRNGNPNGAPHAIAVDDKFIYCAMQGWANEPNNSRAQIQRFDITNGDLVKFTAPELEQYVGHIQLYEWPQRQIPEDTPKEDANLMGTPIRDLDVHGDTIFAADALGGKIQKFHKVTGKKMGEFSVPLPHDLAIDSEGRLWIGYQHSRLSVYSQDGAKLSDRASNFAEIKSLEFGPDGLLYVADGKSDQVKVYDVSNNAFKLVRTFGKAAQPGDYAPDNFYNIACATVDPDGNIITADSLPTGGTRIAKFTPDGTCAWEHMGVMFCDLGSTLPDKPDTVITHRFHRFLLEDKEKGEWDYRGTVLDGDPSLINWQHGVLQFVSLNDNLFAFQCYGDGMQIYRRYGEIFKLVAMVGGVNPRPDGKYNDRLPNDQRMQLGQWTWTDENGNNAADEDEVVWFKQPGKGRYYVFGINADKQGNLLYCDHHTQAIWELPLAGLNPAGNPVFDWRLAHEIVPRDTSKAKFFPLMANRAEDGSIYSFGRSGTWERPGGKIAGYAWMGGWALSKYDKNGNTIWQTKLPNVCVGMDVVPDNKGVMLGYFEKAYIYHYSPDGLLIGQTGPGEAAGNTTGWMDNTSAVSVNRDPKTGILDVFGEDSWLNRMLWYRIDDRDIQTVAGKFTK